MVRLRITNREARKLWSHGLSGPLDVLALIRRIGFLQTDTIRNVTPCGLPYTLEREPEFPRGDAMATIGTARAV